MTHLISHMTPHYHLNYVLPISPFYTFILMKACRSKPLLFSLSPNLLCSFPCPVFDISCVSKSCVGKGRWAGRLNRGEERRGERADTAFSGWERRNDKCWMEFRHYYSGSVLLHCSGTLTHIPNCTLAGFGISFVHFQLVYIIESLRV